MPAGKYSLVIEQGTTVNIDLVYKDSTGSFVDLTSYSAKMQIRPDYADNTTTKYITLSSSLQPDGTGLTLGGISGSINIFISAPSSSALDFDTALYDLEIESPSPSNIVTRLIEGNVRLSKEVTR
jgi:hypothetical protein